MIASQPRVQLVPILAGLLLGTLVTSLSQLAVVTALPVVIASLGGLELYSWAFGAALLTTTLAMPIAGKLSDIYGRKPVYVVGMVTFIAGSALAGSAQTIEQLILFRCVQGLGAGCVAPAVSAVIADLFAPDQRGRWQGINGAIWGLSSVVGPILGGYLAEHISWRWAFYFNVFPGLVAVLLLARFLPPRAGARRQGGRLDYVGMALFSGALLALLLASLWGGRLAPWASAPIAALLLISAALFIAFLRQEARAAEPTVPPELMRNSTYRYILALTLLSGAGLFGAITYAPLYLQAVLGISPTASGMLFLPAVIAMAGLSAVAGIFMHRIGYRRLAIFTMACGAGGFAFLAAGTAELSPIPIVVGLSLVGGGIGLSFPVLIVTAQNAVASRVMGVATSTVQLTRSLGGTLGIALLGAYLSFRVAEVVGGGSLTTADIGSVLEAQSHLTDSSGSAALREELAAAIRVVFAAGAVMMTVATAIAIRLPSDGLIQGTPRPTRDTSA